MIDSFKGLLRKLPGGKAGSNALKGKVSQLHALLERSMALSPTYEEFSAGEWHFKGDAYHRGFWKMLAGGEWERETFDIFDFCIKKGDVVYDVGAWIGPTVLYAARTASKVYAFEPDPVAYPTLLGNVRANGLSNVACFNMAVSQPDGFVRLSSQMDKLFDGPAKLGDSVSSLLPGSATSESVEVPAISFETLQEKFKCRLPDFLKIDIEGGEFGLIPSLRPFLEANRPSLYLSLHAPYLPEADRLGALAAVGAALSGYKHCVYDLAAYKKNGGGTMPVKELSSDKFASDFQTILLLDRD